MATFQDTKEQAEQKVIMHLLSEIERNPSFTQRKLATELGIALGLMNRYLKRCVSKGWVRASQVSPKRISYFLTPDGFVEKSQMVGSYLSRSLTFFRDARAQCEDVMALCQARSWTRVALVGEGDLADIATLVGQGTGISFETIAASTLREHPDKTMARLLSDFDAVMVTDVTNPQNTYDRLRSGLEPDRIIALPLLYISAQREAA